MTDDARAAELMRRDLMGPDPLHFTQAELAQKAGLAQSQVSRVEAGADALLSTRLRVYSARRPVLFP